MTAARLVAGIALLAAVVAIGWLLLAGRDPYTVTAEVDDAGQLVKGNQVRIGASNVGTVSKVRLTDAGTAELELTIDADAAPLRRGTTIAIRANSLVGSANRYVTLTPGGASQPPIPGGGRIELVDTTAPVDVDAVLDSLDKPTRDGLQYLIKGAAEQYDGRTEQARKSLEYLAPALGGSAALLRALADDRDALDRLVAQGAIASRAVASRRGELADLIGNADTTTAAVGDESEALGDTLALLAPTMRKANTTFVDLRAGLDDLDPLVAAAKPATKDLAPFLAELQPLLEEAVPTVKELSATVDKPGAGNDLLDLLAALPPLSKTVRTTLPRAVRTLDRSQKNVDALLQYTPDLVAAVARLGQATSYYDANGHYLRAQPTLGALGYDAGANQLVPRPDSERLAGLQLGTGARCPGAATQPAADGTSPVPVPGCKLSATPPGP